MKEKEFFNWLIKSGQQENTADSTVSRVRRIEAVYPDLDSRIDDNSIDTLMSVFIYTKKDEAKKRVPLHKIKIDGNPYTGTQSLRTALAQYIEFKRASNANIAASVESETSASEVTSLLADSEIIEASDNIYEIEGFRRWMTESGNLKETTAYSYIAYLKALGRYMSIKSDGSSVLGLVYRALREDDTSVAFSILDKVDEKLSALLTSISVSPNVKKDLNNWRSSLRKYVDFLQDELEDLPDEEELDEMDTDNQTLETFYSELNEGEEEGAVEYSVDELKRNFAFRLSTQNRISNDKDIYYPISIIRKLFCYSQRNGKKTSVANNDYDWYKNWISDYVGEIKILFKDKSCKLSDIRAMLLYPATENVYTQLANEKGNLWVYTETTDGNKEPLKAKKLSTIHIDHSPLMAKVLTDNISLIPAMSSLSTAIKKIAKTKRIDLKPKNFGKISKILFADEHYVNSQLLPLIPALKDELNLLREKCTLTLMQASHNLRKK